jgi:hypothetical protein
LRWFNHEWGDNRKRGKSWMEIKMVELLEETAEWEFSSIIPHGIEVMLGEEEKFIWKYRSKFPGFRKH